MAHAAVRHAHLDEDPTLKPDVLDITVSYDGSWHRRGNHSLYGLGAVIDVYTGLVLNYDILSKYCNTCANKTKSLDKTSQEFQE